MEKQKTEEKKETCCVQGKKGKGAIFIPVGLFLGFGIGFALNNIPAGMFVGLGVGFAAFAVSLFIEK